MKPLKSNLYKHKGYNLFYYIVKLNPMTYLWIDEDIKEYGIQTYEIKMDNVIHIPDIPKEYQKIIDEKLWLLLKEPLECIKF